MFDGLSQMLRRFSHIMTMLAVCAFAVAGGTWTHADANDHPHVSVKHKNVADHLHMGADSEDPGDAVHCGSDNVLCSGWITRHLRTVSPIPNIDAPQDRRILISAEPPPPRLRFS